MTATKPAYLDWNATAPLREKARVAVLAAMEHEGNPSSVHGFGRRARTHLETARRQVAQLVGADPANVVFTSGASEAAATLLTPHYRRDRRAFKMGHLYVSAIEHPCVLAGGTFDTEQTSLIPARRDGTICLDTLGGLLSGHDETSGPALVAVMMANNETGVLQPVEEVARLVRSHGGVLIVDAVQAAGRVCVDLKELDADFMILSSHKMGGPKGAGAIVAAGSHLMPVPLIAGGGQEHGHRAGTENGPAIAGFGAACEEAADEIAYFTALAAKRDELESRMHDYAGDTLFYGREAPRLANTLLFSIAGMRSETAQIAFDLNGICLSAGSACSSGKVGPSHVLEAMGVAGKGRETPAGLRLSFGLSTTESDFEKFFTTFRSIAGRNQELKKNRKPAA